MFAFVQNSRVIISVILGLIALTFVGFGLGNYHMTPDEPYLAKVGNANIYQKDVNDSLKRASQPVNANSVELALEQLIKQNLLLQEANKNSLEISPTQIASFIKSRPFLQENGRFSDDLYLRYLQNIGMKAAQFEGLVRRNALIQTQAMPVLFGQIVSKTQAKAIFSMFAEERSIRMARVSPKDFANKVKPSEAELKDVYQKNLQKYRLPEAAKVQFVVLSQKDLASNIAVSDAQAKDFFDKHQKEIVRQQRYISHILLTVPKGASASEKSKIKAQAEEILKQARANPGGFAVLAKAKSQDTGSAAAGGRLGVIERGTTGDKVFEDAVFALSKTGQISDVIETAYGFHVLKLDELKTIDFDSVKDEIIQRIKQQKSAALYRKNLDQLSDLAYNSNDLSKVASKFNLKINTSDWVERTVSVNPMLGNKKVIDEIFSNDVLVKRRNSDPIDLGSNTQIVVHVSDYRKERQLSFDEVKAKILAELTSKEAAKLATNNGLASLKILQSGHAVSDIKWSDKVENISRQKPNDLSMDEISAVFAAKSVKLPAYVGVPSKNGDYVLFKIEKISAAAPASDSDIQKTEQQLAQIYSESQALSYLDVLAKKYPIIKAKLN